MIVSLERVSRESQTFKKPRICDESFDLILTNCSKAMSGDVSDASQNSDVVSSDVSQILMSITDNLKGFSLCECELVTCEFCAISGLCNMVESISVVSNDDTAIVKVETEKNTSPTKTPSLQSGQDHECQASLNTSLASAESEVPQQDHRFPETDSALGDKCVPPEALSDGGCLSLSDGSRFSLSSTWNIGRFKVVSWVMINIRTEDVNHQGPSKPETSSQAPTGSSVFSKFKSTTLKAPSAQQLKKKKPAHFKNPRRTSKKRSLEQSPAQSI